MNSLTHRHAQRGTSLLELLIAFVVLAVGMITIARLHGDLRQHAELSRQRHEAIRLAQQDLESLRAFSVMSATPGSRAWSDVVSAEATVDAEHGLATNTVYHLTRAITDATAPNLRQASVTVAWTDRAGSPRSIVLDSMLAGVDPASSGTLALDAGRSAAQRPLARSTRIPVAAKNLGDGTSVLKPAAAGSVAFVFDNESGAVTARCSGIATAVRTRDIGTADLTSCVARPGLLLSGEIRFTSTAPPLPGDANDAPLPLAILLTLAASPAEPPLCVTEARKTVRYALAGSLRIEAVPIDALPASFGVASWTETGDRHTAYHCVVTPAEGETTWSGRSTLLPSGWTIGTGSADRRVCRFASDIDASGAVDLAIEHGAQYSAVSSALTHQNFLVVKGSEACPAASPVTIEGQAGDVFADLSTAALMP